MRKYTESINNLHEAALNEAITPEEKLKIEGKIECLEFLNQTYKYPKAFIETHEAYIRELKNRLEGRPENHSHLVTKTEQ